MADHRRTLILKKLKSGRPVSQPTDIFKRPANLTVFVSHLRGMKCAPNRLNEGENETFRGHGLQIGEMGWPDEKANEKAERAFAGNWFKPEIKTAQTLRMLNFCTVTA